MAAAQFLYLCTCCGEADSRGEPCARIPGKWEWMPYCDGRMNVPFDG